MSGKRNHCCGEITWSSNRKSHTWRPIDAGRTDVSLPTGGGMFRAILPVVAGSVLLGCAVGSYAADSNGMPTKAQKNVSAPLTQPSSCSTFQEFLLTGCQLSWYGVRLYGTIDVGYGYQTHGAPWDPFFASGASYFLQKMNRSSMWTLAPNGLSQSNLGIQI